MDMHRSRKIGRRTMILAAALLSLGAFVGTSNSAAAQVKYRGKMVERPPAGPQAREPVTFTVVKARRNQKTRRKRPGRAKRIKDFTLERPAGTTCQVTEEITFTLEELASVIPDGAQNDPHRIKRDGTFRFRDTGRIPVSGLAGSRAVDGADFIAWQRGVVGRLKRNGTATGRARLSFSFPGGGPVCDSYGKRDWTARKVRR